MTMTATIPPVEATGDQLLQRFVLEDVAWRLYELLLKEVGDRHIFITFDEGRLELMSPSRKHETRGRLLGLLVRVVAETLDVPLEGCGSTTFRRKDLDRGLEPDECFYVRNVEKVIGKDSIDLPADPPPDLAIEVEVS